MNKIKTIEIKCYKCGKIYLKDIYQHARSIRLNRKEFCSMKCSTEYRDEKIGKEGWKNIHKYLIKENSVFSQMLRNAQIKCQQRNKEINVDVEYLKNLWEFQQGICPYTKIKMKLPESGSEYTKQYSLEKASLDRIDSSKGYIKGNVEFVCLAINYAKNNRTRDEMKLFIEKIISHGQTTIQINTKQLQEIPDGKEKSIH